MVSLLGSYCCAYLTITDKNFYLSIKAWKLCVEWERTNTGWHINFHYVKIYGIWGWRIHCLNGWGSYGKVSSCFNTGLQGSTLSNHCMTTGLGPFELRTVAYYRKGRTTYCHKHVSTNPSTVTTLLTATYDWFQMLDSGKEVCAVFFDIQKALDTVPHHALMQKLRYAGLNIRILHWICSYLTDREQKVLVNGATSNSLPVILESNRDLY